MDHHHTALFLIGHSQGGAAAAQLCCSDKVVSGANIVGLLMLGSESPIEVLPSRAQQYMAMTGEAVEYDPEPPHIVHLEKPRAIPTEFISIIHSENDKVISSLLMKQLAETWGCRYVGLQYPDKSDSIHVDWAADVQHDFLSRDMLRRIIDLTFNELQTVPIS